MTNQRVIWTYPTGHHVLDIWFRDVIYIEAHVPASARELIPDMDGTGRHERYREL